MINRQTQAARDELRGLGTIDKNAPKYPLKLMRLSALSGAIVGGRHRSTK